MRQMIKNCSIFYVASKQRFVLQCSQENTAAIGMGDPTCRLSALTSPGVLGKFILMIADESTKPWPATTGEKFKEVTASTVKLMGFARWSQMEKETELCWIRIQEGNAVVTRWVRSGDLRPRERGYESSKDMNHQIVCPIEPRAIGEAVFRLFDINS